MMSGTAPDTAWQPLLRQLWMRMTVHGTVPRRVLAVSTTHALAEVSSTMGFSLTGGTGSALDVSGPGLRGVVDAGLQRRGCVLLRAERGPERPGASESVPVLEASWDAAREIERLQVLGVGLLTEPDPGPGTWRLAQLRISRETGEGPEPGQRCRSSGRGRWRRPGRRYGMAEVMDDLALNRDTLSTVDQTAADLRVA